MFLSWNALQEVFLSLLNSNLDLWVDWIEFAPIIIAAIHAFEDRILLLMRISFRFWQYLLSNCDDDFYSLKRIMWQKISTIWFSSFFFSSFHFVIFSYSHCQWLSWGIENLIRSLSMVVPNCISIVNAHRIDAPRRFFLSFNICMLP